MNFLFSSELIKSYVLSVIRTAITPLTLLLVKYGFLTNSQAGKAAIVIASVIVTLLWSLADKYIWSKTVDQALELPEGSNREDLK
jgi:hypothetical protein